jgi:hypothetical protein
MSEEGIEASQPTEDTKVVDGRTYILRGGVWYKERKGSKTSSTQPIGIGDVKGRWTSGMEITSAYQRGREGGLRKSKPNHS